MKISKLFSFMLAAFLTAGILSACGGNDEPSSSDTTVNGEKIKLAHASITENTVASHFSEPSITLEMYFDYVETMSRRMANDICISIEIPTSQEGKNIDIGKPDSQSLFKGDVLDLVVNNNYFDIVPGLSNGSVNINPDREKKQVSVYLDFTTTYKWGDSNLYYTVKGNFTTKATFYDESER